MSIVFRSACFFSTDNGTTVQTRANAQSEKDHALPSGVTNLLRIDETQSNNAAVLADWSHNSAPYTMSGSTLLKSGSPVGIDPPGLAFTALQNFNDMLTKAGTPDAWTQAEVGRLVALVGFLLSSNSTYS